MLKRQILLPDNHHRHDHDLDHHHHDCDPQLTDDLDLLLFTNASNNSNLLELVEEPVERWEEVVFVFAFVFVFVFVFVEEPVERWELVVGDNLCEQRVFL